MKTEKLVLIAMAICLHGNYVNAQNKILRDSLIAYYPFNDDFNDKSGNNYNGKVNGPVLTGTTNKACFFDGINDYIEVPGIEPLKTVKQLTISCWINPVKVNRYVPWISKANDNNRNSQWRLSFGPDPYNLVQLTFFNGDWKNYDFNFQFEMNRWYHVIYLIDNTDHKASIYIDGNNIKSFDISELSTSGGPLLIGCQNEARSFYNGLIDEALIYTRLLKEDEIKMLYDNFKNSEKAEIDPKLIAACLRAGEIHPAVAAGDLDKVRMLIEVDPTLLELKDNNGNTALNLACLHGFTREPAIAKFLIDKGANVNTKNNDGFTPLHGASSFAGFSGGADFDLVQLLITRGADINAQDNYGRTPLHFSVGSIKIASLLIEHGADVNASVGGNTALHLALSYDSNDEMSKLLIESGAKPNQKDKLGNTELHLAAMRGFTDVIRLLVKNGADVNTVNNSNHTALYYATKHGYRGAADALIAAGADKSTIVETNYGKAPQLSATLKQGEAYLWYMKIGGYAVKTKNHLLILPQIISIDTSLEAGLVNGQLNPNELAGQNIIVLTHFPRGDFLNTDEGRLAILMPEAEWVFYSGRPTEINKDIQGLPSYHLIGPNEDLSFGEIQVHTTPLKKGVGVGFLFEVDGVKIFDGLSHASTNEASMVEEYRKGIDSLKSYGPIDIALLRVRSDRGNAYEPYLYLIDQLSPKIVYLIEGITDPEEYLRCANFLRARNIQVKHPETNAIAGDRFHYIRE